jgi:cell division protein FtsL
MKPNIYFILLSNLVGVGFLYLGYKTYRLQEEVEKLEETVADCDKVLDDVAVFMEETGEQITSLIQSNAELEMKLDIFGAVNNMLIKPKPKLMN